MYFASDNSGPALPAVLQAMIDANAGYATSYGDDALMDEVRDRIRTLFEAPQASVYLVATGTAANALALATLSQPWQTVFCTPLAHIHVDECNAPEFFTGGAKLSLVGQADKMTPDELRQAIAAWPKGDVHAAQHGPLALTQATERGRIYSCQEIAALCTVARDHGLPTYMDGARFANAVAALGCSPAEMTWKAGIDAVSMGGTKNGCLGVEAVIFFAPENAWEFELRRKRSAHLFSKHRYLSAQMLGYLRDHLWLETAQEANARAARLATGLRSVPGARMVFERDVNMIFASLPRATHQRLKTAGAVYFLYEGPLDTGPADEPLLARFVCDWSITEAQIEAFLSVARGD
ncbi:MAG: low specificity L-threonine aldolase [Rhodobacteraceae bacterium CG17_big_fil_post_rev_8_21_14_2_50_63_15]|nr:low specificity L-threonine aldolase [Roseovarius sp.]PIV79409.1 MAG: low specificity L-threonine aldolase [Rhodobacteraceae bacterium CG17_big_fil_post_rev_8_21_14_2_50_63_15]